ncbi:bifunctional protein-serine/threonine kinase/phosphatase [Rhizobacter sp. Root404]|uniref:bifunctional protein-serine/threonine kinase/phosphatase n=1 Tax=Rhizobacter sp. Root404 TaxID=1736528 RepID=UPI0006F5B090|nr:bifunctional protein-serine/threonine kinase/phosphatase [Rhizobacter sp. Root404]KQW38804.1 serine/threonine protein phosphatase [Rhizobacter sp. Root404]
MSFDVDIGHFSLQGPRERNEDFAAAARPAPGDATRGVVAAIADGVSGGGAGREAAQTSVMSVVADYHGAPDTWETSVVLDRLISAQNAWLADHNRRRQGARDGADAPLAMSTLTVLVLRGQAWMLAHVGDTRAWLLRDAPGSTTDCVQLTQDHAFEEAFQRSRLTRAMGLDDRVRVDFEQGELRIGDTFVLTTDGVHGVLDRARLLALAGAHASAQAASEAIVNAAIAAGTRDNATALVLRVNGLDASRFEDALLQGRGLPALQRRKVGDTVDGYVITAPLADTGVHRLYQAREIAGGALVVLKTLHESRAHDAQERAMLVHEAWLASRVAERHPPRGEAGFVCTHEPAQPSAFYTVFDWHAGVTLEAMLGQGRRFAVADIVDGTIAVARALARLHRHGVIHRDIKPGNLYLGDDGQWRVLDLGAALSGSDPAALRALHAGTPSYMNPEQWGLGDAEPQPADAPGDLYALGVTLYQWLTGKLPYGEIEPYQGGRFRRDPKPPSRLRPDVPIWLDQVALKAVALDPRQRFETAEELVLALERGASRPLAALAGTPLLARHPTALWQIALGASLLFNALLIYWLLFLPR